MVLVILGLSLTCAPLSAQESNATSELQTESPFAEEIKHLETAADKAARVAAFDRIFARAVELKREPEPLVSILRNKKPENAYEDLLAHIRDSADARHESFIQPLITCANDAGEAAKVAAEAVCAYGKDAVPVIRLMLESEVAGERLAAAAVARYRVGGTGGVAKVIPDLVKAMDRNEPDLTGVVIRSLKRVTLLEYDKPERWKEWLGNKDELALVTEIADREHAARIKAQEDAANASKALRDAALEQMRNVERNNPRALLNRLKSDDSEVRKTAVQLLAELVRAAEESIRAEIIAAAGSTLNDQEEVELVRIECARLLASCGQPDLAYPYINKALEVNGIGADLRLELVKGLNAPVAAAMVARLLRGEIDVVETRSGAVLEALIAQVRSVVQIEDTGENKQAILAELSRLLELVSAKIQGELEAPARKRYIDLATRTCETLVHIARLRRVDISATVDALSNLALTENGAATSAMTALREALNVPTAREGVLTKLTTEPVATQLQTLYQKLVSGGEEAMLINVLGLYETMRVAPEPVDALRKRLIDRAESTEAALPAGPDSRKTMRDALRGLLARLLTTDEEHTLLVQDLSLAKYGDNDALGYLMLLKASRVAITRAGLSKARDTHPIRVALLLLKLDERLTAEERATPEYVDFRNDVNRLARSGIAGKLGKALRDGLDDESRKEITGLAGGPLRDLFVPAALDELRKKPEAGDARDTLSEVLLSVLKQAHPNKYDNLVLKGLNKDDYLKALDDLNTRLKNDGYSVP